MNFKRLGDGTDGVPAAGHRRYRVRHLGRGHFCRHHEPRVRCDHCRCCCHNRCRREVSARLRTHSAGTHRPTRCRGCRSAASVPALRPIPSRIPRPALSRTGTKRHIILPRVSTLRREKDAPRTMTMRDFISTKICAVFHRNVHVVPTFGRHEAGFCLACSRSWLRPNIRYRNSMDDPLMQNYIKFKDWATYRHNPSNFIADDGLVTIVEPPR